MIKRSDRTVVFLIFVLALILRYVGIQHGFPFIFHPDEPTIARSALGIRFFPNPGHFDWPHLYIYINYFMFMGFAYARDFLANAGLKETISNLFPLMWNDEVVFYFLTRSLTAFLGALTVVPVYKAAKNIFNGRVGILSAFVFAILPFHVHHSHYSLADVPMVFLLAWGMYFGSKIIKINDPGFYASAGVYSGLAASTKYNGGLSLINVPIAHLIRVIKSKDEELIDFKGIFNLIIAGFMALLGFLIGTPYAFLDYRTFIRTDGPKGALWQFTNVGSVELSQRIPKFFSEMIYRISDDLGYTVIILFFLAIVYVLYKKVRKRYYEEETDLWYFIIPALFLLIYISGFEKSRSHYYLISYPYIAVVAGYALSRIFAYAESKIKYLSFLVLFLLLLPPFYLSTLKTYRFYNGDTRQDLSFWLDKNAEPNSAVVYDDDSFKPVFDLKSYDSQKGLDKLSLVKSGYLVIDSEKIVEYEANYNFKQSNLQKITEINSKYRLGPDISIYKIGN